MLYSCWRPRDSIGAGRQSYELFVHTLLLVVNARLSHIMENDRHTIEELIKKIDEVLEGTQDNIKDEDSTTAFLKKYGHI